jgi:hypothetical protein
MKTLTSMIRNALTSSIAWNDVGHLLLGEIPVYEPSDPAEHDPPVLSNEDDRPCCYRSRFNEDGLDFKLLCEFYSGLH